MNPQQFKQALAQHQIMLSEQQVQQFALYYQLLIKGNEQLNLTTITDEGDVYLKHFFDSLTPAFSVDELQTQSLTLCDVGAGAGFPSLPLKIVFPNLRITIVDSLNKRIKFLEQLVEQLGLTDVTLIHDRAETFGAKKSPYRSSFDIVTARAVARLSVLSELCLPLVNVGGTFIALKASQADDELQQAQTAITTLGAKVIAVDQLELPQSDEPRTIIVIKKTKQTPGKYPRRPGVPGKKPL
ncbi:16S rRNA (guanine(527)-N(7))-methyltransferase RsmG [Paucilactobacillus wasatchensis]|uniref:Ribosomal RNA small subunit methyltransferase G n=1 Tax=Paucilactobacillus wasatchensis TaxID=1335616 RepID=A0A0D1A968_9LACO|nr:16S rRNA (guanine(527)-N(7))-methyltransferase RsmG [Paucilactobacillus wasatchensis]KIS04365.1 rRNA small subunit 7-methylguanosine (m7G) methyltransferase [Paucilactobacillus wasatchensis]